MRVTLISRSWPTHERSGVSLAAAEHVRMLAELGHEVSIVGADPSIRSTSLPVVQRIHVPARGSGALYAPVRIDRDLVRDAIQSTRPDLVITEAWQTALTDTFVDEAADARVPVLMVSHGISVDAFEPTPTAWLRAAAWAPYRHWRLPRLVGRLAALTTLDTTATSPRFRDRDIARAQGIPVVPLGNAPVHWSEESSPDRDRRDPVVLVIGYYSAIKNQLGALDVAASLRDSGLRFRFVGPRRGSYFERCRQRAQVLGLGSQVEFLEDDECDLAREMGRACVVLSVSMTEGLPITLIEAMASRTPFVATPVGAVPSLMGGMLASTIQAQSDALRVLVHDASAWAKASASGRAHYESSYSRARIKAAVADAVNIAAGTLRS